MRNPILHTLSFNGCYDGNYHMIKNLNCDTEADYAGLFGMIGNDPDTTTNSCILSNLSVYGSIKTEGKNAGGIAGTLCTGGTVQNCSFVGHVAAAESAGGIVGTVYFNSKIQYCYQNGKVSAETNAGGLVGSVRFSSINQIQSTLLLNSYHTGGAVTAAQNGFIGGIAGFTEESSSLAIPALKMDNNYYLSDNCMFAVCNQTADGCTALSNASMKKHMKSLMHHLLRMPVK